MENKEGSSSKELMVVGVKLPHIHLDHTQKSVKDAFRISDELNDAIYDKHIEPFNKDKHQTLSNLVETLWNDDTLSLEARLYAIFKASAGYGEIRAKKDIMKQGPFGFMGMMHEHKDDDEDDD